MVIKRIISVFTALALCVSLAACGTTAASSSADAAPEAASSAAASPEAAAPQEETPASPETAGAALRIAGLKGPTTMGLVNLMNSADGASYEFDLEAVQSGRLSPVFFGSALTNFGVEPFLADFLRLSTPPLPRNSDIGLIDPMRPDFSGFIFKIQANMNKAHRDRIAFLRITSGKFTRGMEVYHVQGGKKVKLAQSTQLMAQDRATVDEAYAGDIVGLFDPGIFSIGDTLCNGKEKFAFEGIPTFAPEHFARVTQVDTMKRKQFVKGMEQIAQEGAIQIFRELGGGMEEVIVGAVGVLQFEVLEYRLKNEYNVDIRMQTLPYEHIRWIENEDLDPKTLDLTSDTKRIEDLKGRRLILFTNPWSINWALQHNDGLQLSEFGRNQ